MSFNSQLESIKKAWPQERIEKSKSRLTAIWNGKLPADRIPFVIERIPDENGVNLEILESFGYSPDVSLYFNLSQIEKRAVLEDDYIPSLYAGYRQNMIPSGFGASEVIKFGATQYWSEPLVKKPQDVYDLDEFSLKVEGSTLKLLLENMRYFRKMTKGSLPLHLVDSQDAMANASTIMDINEYFAAMSTHPQEIHFVHSRCNEAIKSFIDEQIDISEGDYIPMNTFWFGWIPEGQGLSLSIDLLAMISPKNVEDFVLPYLNELSQRYNGLLVHSCGKWDHNMGAIKKTEKLKGVDFGVTESDIGKALEVFGHNIEYALHNSYVAVAPFTAQSQEEYIIRISSFIKENNIPAQVQVFVPPSYSMGQAIELNRLALRYFCF